MRGQMLVDLDQGLLEVTPLDQLLDFGQLTGSRKHRTGTHERGGQ